MNNETIILIIIIIIIVLLIIFNSSKKEKLTITGLFSSLKDKVQPQSTIPPPSPPTISTPSPIEPVKPNNIMDIDIFMKKNLDVSGNINLRGNTNINKMCFEDKCLEPNQIKNFINYWNIKDKMFDNAKVYDDIFVAYTSGVIFKSGNPPGWDETTYKTNKLYDKTGLRIGTNSNYPNGLGVIVPNGCNMIWLSLLNERWNVFKIFKEDGSSLGLFCGGFRNLNTLYPDGSITNSHYNHNIWTSIPVPKSGKYIICSVSIPNKGGDDFWITGIGFSNNLWNYATNSALAYHWKINNEPVGMDFETDNWNNDIVVRFTQNIKTRIFVPVVPSNNDKLLFFVEHNNNLNGLSMAQIFVNNVLVERIKTSYNNPFSIHHNSKNSSRYCACLIPKSLIKPDDYLITVDVDMTGTNFGLKVREIGTHDYY